MTSGAAQLHRFLKSNRITQSSMAIALGVSGPTIHDWVSGSKRPRAHYREAIAIWTNGAVPVDSWIQDDERQAVSIVRPFATHDMHHEP